MNTKQLSDLQHDLGLINASDPGVDALADITKELINIIQTQQVEIDELRASLGRVKSTQAAVKCPACYGYGYIRDVWHRQHVCQACDGTGEASQ